MGLLCGLVAIVYLFSENCPRRYSKDLKQRLEFKIHIGVLRNMTNNG